MLLFMTAAPPPEDGAVLDQLLRRIAQGDQDALAQLYRQTRSAVYGFALSLVKNTHDAEDVLQEVYLRVWSTAAGYQARGKPLAWLLTVTRNLALDRLRQQSRTLPLEHEDALASLEYRSAVTPEDRMTLAALLDTLSDPERQIVTLHALAGLKHREIGAMLGLPLPTVLSKYNRAIKKLQAAWKEAEQHD